MDSQLVLPSHAGQQKCQIKFRDTFGSKVPPIERWIALDLYLTDEDPYRSGPHIRMDANNEDHWRQVADYLTQHDVQVQTVAFTAFGPSLESDILKKTILPIVKKGGLCIYPGYFATEYSSNTSADVDVFGDIWFCPIQGLLFPRFHDQFLQDVREYHISKIVTSKDLLLNLMKDEKHPIYFDVIRRGKLYSDAYKKLIAKIYVNRVSSFKPEYLDNKVWRALSSKAREEVIKTAFSKLPEDFTRDYIVYFREYMEEIGYSPTTYESYSKAIPNRDGSIANLAQYYGVTEYVYAQDGTFDLSSYNRPSLVLIKQ